MLRIITRLNIGGPAIQAALLSTRLDPERFETLLVAGSESSTEGNMLELGRFADVRELRRLPWLAREISPLNDLRALAELTRIARRFRPDIVHTHLAKAGTLGRLAARAAGTPLVIHTYHGTVFQGYFGAGQSRVVLEVERKLAWMSTRLIALTPRLRKELIDLGIGDDRKVIEVPLGLDLAPFLGDHDPRAARSSLGLPPDVPVVALVARLVPVKNVDLFLSSIARADPRVVAVIVGDGQERARLESLAEALGIGARCRFFGWQRDVGLIYAAADVVVLTSRNEGSPVSLIEAMATGRAVVSTAVGGVPDVIADGQTGCLVHADDAAGLAATIDALLHDPVRRLDLAMAARNAVYPRYDISRLVTDISALYEGLVS